MIFIKPEEKEEFTSRFLLLSLFFKLHYLEIQMWILVTEKSLKSLKLCFFLAVVIYFLSVLVTIFRINPYATIFTP